MRVTGIVSLGLLFAAVQVVAQETPQQPAAPQFSVAEVKAAAQDPMRFTVDDNSVEIIRLDPPSKPEVVDPNLPPIGIPKPPSGSGGNPGLPPVTPPGGGGIGDDLVVIDKIVNLAKKIWDIIKENQPSIDTKTCYANAIPDGITSWTQLQQWSPPKTATYGFYAKNMYGSKTIEVVFQVVRTDGGNYKGKGKYLNGVSVQPLKVEASWGYKFTMAAEVPSVANVGTSEDPIASMLLRLNYKIETVVKHSEGTYVYYTQGDGAFREIGSPFKKSALSPKTGKTIQDLAEKLEKNPDFLQ